MIIDTAPIVAALNAGDPDHERCRDLVIDLDDRIIPGATLVEIDYLVHRAGGGSVWSQFISDVRAGSYRVMHPNSDDLSRAAELEEQYSDLRLGFVDASVIALCERLEETHVATLDHRHFSVVRPRHCRALTLLPE